MPRLLAIAVVSALAATPAAQARPVDKLDGSLRQLVRDRGHARARPLPGPLRLAPAAVSSSGRVRVDVYVRGSVGRAARTLRREGLRIDAVSGHAPARMVEGSLPVAALDDVAGLRPTRAVLPVPEPIYNTGSRLSEGDAAHRGPQARAQGYTGAGVAVGIMSDSINKVGSGVAGSQATGDLPPGVQILDDPSSGTDEGRAMAEIVYDEAPGISKIVFARGGGGPANRAANIDALVNAGSEVIADDTVYLTEPFFQDGVIAQAADRAKAAGTAYFVSAGNRARQSWEGRFAPSASNSAENDFDSGAGEDRRQTLATLPANSTAQLVLQWDDPYGAAATNFAIDVYAVSSETGTPTASTTTNNVATGLPVESATIQNNTGSPVAMSIGIRRVAGTGTNPAPRLKWIYNGSSTTAVPGEYATASNAIDPDAASAAGTLAVAAVRYSDSGVDNVESFSSRGPAITRYFGTGGNRLATPDVRPKPDIAGADGVSTDLGASSGLNPFYGTSAAAPSVAGVGALLLSARPSLSVDELYAILRDPRGSVDCAAPGFPDADCGSGFPLADQKLKVLDSTPPTEVPVLSPAAPDGTNGWYRSSVGVRWDLSDPGSLIVSSSGCEARSVNTDGESGFTCTAASAGGSSSQSVQFKRDGTRPTAPVISGIAPGTFRAAAVPAQSAIGCSATDALSGIASCVVSGYSASPGAHTLTATATDQAGNPSTSTLAYQVVRPAAATQLSVSRRQRLRALPRKGFAFALTVATERTKVSANLRYRRTVVGTLRSTVSAGRRSFKVKLTRAGKKALARRRSAKLALTGSASGGDATTARFSRSVTLKR